MRSKTAHWPEAFFVFVGICFTFWFILQLFKPEVYWQPDCDGYTIQDAVADGRDQPIDIRNLYVARAKLYKAECEYHWAREKHGHADRKRRQQGE